MTCRTLLMDEMLFSEGHIDKVVNESIDGHISRVSKGARTMIKRYARAKPCHYSVVINATKLSSVEVSQ